MRLFLGGVELFDKSRGGDETRHKYLTHSEWHKDSKFVGLLKVGYQTSILEIKFKKCLKIFRKFSSASDTEVTPAGVAAPESSGVWA